MREDEFYQDFRSEVAKEVAIVLGKVTHFLHKDIVDYISEKNIDFEKEFNNFSTVPNSFNNNDFFGDDCVFPGYRRVVNGERKDKWKNNLSKDGTILNDNTIPRHIWAFLTIGKCYSGPNWKESKLNKFELAHIFNHKVDEIDFERKYFKNINDKIKPYSLFSSASNVVLIPKGLAKPTDNLDEVKLCFYNKFIDYYKKTPKGINGFRKDKLPLWYDDVKWNEPKLPKDWKKNIDKLLVYRSENLKKRYNK